VGGESILAFQSPGFQFSSCGLFPAVRLLGFQVLLSNLSSEEIQLRLPQAEILTPQLVSLRGSRKLR
jgi:hypothetical protein